MAEEKMTEISDRKVIKDNYEGNSKSERIIDPRPEFTITADTLPAIKDWSVGKKYKLEIEVEMTGSRIEDWGDDKGKLKCNFKISGIMVDNDFDDKAADEDFPEAMRIKKNK